MLVLDGCVQLTQRDEFSYQARRRGADDASLAHSTQEMMAHIPLCALKGPLRRVLVVRAS